MWKSFFAIVATCFLCVSCTENKKEPVTPVVPIFIPHDDSAEEQNNNRNTVHEIIEDHGQDNHTDPEPEPQKKYKQCPVCYGSGRCGGCGGGGLVYNAIDYNPGQYVDCSACGGTGQCGFCEGSGMVEDLGW